MSEFIHRWEPGKGRVILALHGTGGDENDLVPIAKMLDPRAAILSPRGRVLEGSHNRFFRRFEEGVFDFENMREETAALADFVVQKGLEYGFDPLDVYALGFSNGANIAASLLLSRPDVLKGGILLRSMVPFQPSAPVDLKGKSVMMINGSVDPIIPVENANRLAEIFRVSGADVKHVILETGHQLMQEDVRLSQEWLKSQ
jgi:phospholipase/carboxylesterase